MFIVSLIEGDVDFSNKAFRTLKCAKNFAQKIMDETNEWGAVSFGKTLLENEHTVLVRWDQGGSVEEMSIADWLNT